MRFVHLADAHLDTSFAGRSERVRRRLRDASRLAFRRAVDLAIREDVHALLIAGDLFDGSQLSFQTERFLLEQAQRLADHGITVVYATGNHDPGNPESGPRSLRWPANVLVASDDTPQRLTIHGANGEDVGVVTTIGHASGRETRDLSRLMPRPRGDLPEVALLHTQVHASDGAEGHMPYAPSDLGFLTRAGFDYWALGHIHKRQFLSSDPPVVYPGSLQGKTRSETGAHGALLVDLTDREHAATSFRSLAPVRWETIHVGELDAADSLDLLERRIESGWNQFREAQDHGSDTEWIVRVVLSGASPLWRELQQQENRATVEEGLRATLDVLDVDLKVEAIHPPVDLEEHAARTDVLGEALRLADEVRSGETSLHIDAADLAGLSSDDPAAVTEYVKKLLQGADGEIAARLLGLGGGGGR